MSLRVEIGTIDPATVAALGRAASAASERIIAELEQSHRELTASGLKPDGTRQPGRGGGDGVPLYGDGRFATGSVVTKQRDSRELRAAPHVARGLQYIHARGQLTIWAELPKGFEDRALQIVQEEVDRAMSGGGAISAASGFAPARGI